MNNIYITNECNMQLMARYPDNYFDLAIVDPPYGMTGNKFCTINKKFIKQGFAVAEIDSGGETGFSLGKRPQKEYWDELFRVSKNQIVFGMQYFINFLPPKQCVLIWDKKNHNSRQSSAEIAWTSFDYGVRIFTFDHRTIPKIHPTEKPVKLYEWIFKHHMNSFCKKDYKILDTHLGSGSIAIAVDNVNKIDKMNLTLTACDIDKDYFDSAMKRIKNETNWLPVF